MLISYLCVSLDAISWLALEISEFQDLCQGGLRVQLVDSRIDRSVGSARPC